MCKGSVARREISMKSLLNYFVIGLLLISLAVTTVYPTLAFWDTSKKQVSQFCGEIVDQTRDSLITTIKNFDSRWISLADSDTIYEGICQGKLENASSQDFREAFMDFFPIAGMDFHYVHSVDLYVKKTEQLYRIGYCTETLSDPFSVRNAYHKAALSSPLNLNWIGYNENLHVLELVKLIYDTETYEELGLMVIRVSPAFFLKEFENFDGLDIQNMYLLDESQRILCSLKSNQIGQQLNTSLQQDMLQENGTIYISRDFSKLNHSRYVGSYAQWRIVIEVDEASLYDETKTVLSLTIFVSILLLTLGVLTVMLFSRSITHPILAVEEGFRHIERMDYSHPISRHTFIQEPEAIINGYNHMLEHLKQLTNNIYQEKEITDKLRFKSLQATITPHFLFNTLQLISWKAYAYHANDICAMIKSLSFMLESDLAQDVSPYSTLADELEYLRHYILIIRYKHEDKIDFLIDVPEAYHNRLVPRLTLQPLIENAVSHGLSRKMASGTVSLNVSVEGGMLCLRVEDDGVGMAPDQLERIRENILEDGGAAERTEGTSHNIAIRNIYKRLKLLYQEHFSFTVDSQLFRGTTIVIKIPDAIKEDAQHV